MHIELPTVGCNILNNSSSFYNYSPDNMTRTSYVIVENEYFISSISQSSYGPYTHTGDCLSYLPYKPEYEYWFSVGSALIAFVAFWLVFRLIFRKWWRNLK